DFTFTGDSRRLCTWEADYRLRVWDVRTGRLIAEHVPRPEGFPKELDDEDNPRRRRGGPGQRGFGATLCFFPGGEQFLWLFKKLRSYDTTTGREVELLNEELRAGYYRPQISKDGEWLLLGGGGEPTRTLVNLRQKKKVGLLEFGADSGAQAMSPD